jgi:hypothetical protein
VLVPAATAPVLAPPPVAGRVKVVRGFSFVPAAPFAAGRHRGADLAAPPGAVVRAACSGRVAAVGWASVTLRCGAWRVTLLPVVTSPRVRAGVRVRAGRVLGRVGASEAHAGLHVGVRREGDAFGYVDPVPLLRRAGGRGVPPVAVPAPPGIARRGPRPAAPAPATRGVSTPGRAPVRVSVPGHPGGLAPWPAWAGLTLLSLGAVGSGVRIGLRRRHAPAEVAVASAR